MIINNYVVTVSFVATLASTIFLLREKLVELLLLLFLPERDRRTWFGRMLFSAVFPKGWRFFSSGS